MKPILMCLSSLVFSGCMTTAVPVVSAAPQCEAPAGRLPECSDPVAIKQGITFGELIGVSARDRDSLRECALRHKSLAGVVAACKDGIEKFNAEIREINARNAKQ